MPIEESKLDELRAKFGEVWTLTIEGQDFVLRCPSMAEYERYTDKMAGDRKGFTAASRAFAAHAVIHPDAGAFAAMVERRPGYAVRVAGEAMAIASGEAAEAAKK
jgi:hypothetical protein